MRINPITGQAKSEPPEFPKQNQMVITPGGFNPQRFYDKSQIDALLANFSPNTPTTEQSYSIFVYNSSGIQEGNRFNDFGDLYVATRLTAGYKIVIFEDNEIIANLNIVGATVGDTTTLDMSGVQFWGDNATSTAALKVRWGDTTTNEQIVFSNWDGGSTDKTVVMTNACPSYIYDPGVSVSLFVQGASVLRGIRAPFARLSAQFDLLNLNGGVLTRNPQYPIGLASIVGASWSGGTLTINFPGGNQHGIDSQYIGTNIRLSGFNPGTYDGSWEITAILDSETIEVAMVSDPGAFVSGNDTWYVGEPAVIFDGATFHIISWDGGSPFLDTNSLGLDAGSLLVDALASVSARRQYFSAAFQDDVLGTILPPTATGTFFSKASNVFYDNAASGLSATEAQGAVDELASEKLDKTAASDSFTTVDLKTVTVVDGAITSIV